MSEALRQQAPVASQAVPAELRELLPPLRPTQVNDNDKPAPRVGERRMFEIPAAIWCTMLGSYALFLLALLGATGGARAGFAIAISAVYVAMFFGTARVMLGQAPEQPRSPLAPFGGKLPTLYGPLGRGEVVAQMLVVPAAVAFFGIAVLIIRLWAA